MTDDLHAVLPQTSAVIEEGIRRGLHRGVQVSVSRNGVVIADGAIGSSHENVPLTRDTLLPWLSAGKPLTSVCVLRLIEAGQLKLETPVTDVVPEFSAAHAVTIRHLLTHTAGLRPESSGWPQSEWEDVIRSICEAGLKDDWIPGERAGYDPVRSWFLLGEIVRRLDGRPVEQVVREDVMRPIGMHDSWMAMPPENHAGYGDRIGRTYFVKGRDEELTEGHTLAYCTAPSPGSSCRGPIRELRMFYETLLAGGVAPSGERILNADSVALMTQRHREGMYDETFQHTLDCGLGVIINSNRYGVDAVIYGYGRQASEETFGHGGARSCIAFADPERQLTVAIVANGYCTEPQHQRRMRSILDALEADTS